MIDRRKLDPLLARRLLGMASTLEARFQELMAAAGPDLKAAKTVDEVQAVMQRIVDELIVTFDAEEAKTWAALLALHPNLVKH